eukprot:403363891
MIRNTVMVAFISAVTFISAQDIQSRDTTNQPIKLKNLLDRVLQQNYLQNTEIKHELQWQHHDSEEQISSLLSENTQNQNSQEFPSTATKQNVQEKLVNSGKQFSLQRLLQLTNESDDQTHSKKDLESELEILQNTKNVLKKSVKFEGEEQVGDQGNTVKSERQDLKPFDYILLICILAPILLLLSFILCIWLIRRSRLQREKTLAINPNGDNQNGSSYNTQIQMHSHQTTQHINMAPHTNRTDVSQLNQTSNQLYHSDQPVVMDQSYAHTNQTHH